jgi:hypothetical protein
MTTAANNSNRLSLEGRGRIARRFSAVAIQERVEQRIKESLIQPLTPATSAGQALTLSLKGRGD